LFADLNILKILNQFYNVDFKIQMKKGGMTPLHFAAQSYEGLVAIYFLKDI
jgi:elongation factor P hydroxylase